MIGVFFILAAAGFLAIQNVVLKMMVSVHDLMGLVPFGGWVSPTLDHSLLLLQLRMLLTIPLMLLLAPRLHPGTVEEIQWLCDRTQFQKPDHRRYIGVTLGAYLCIWIALVLLYIAIGRLSTGVAATLFSIHPAVTALLAWLQFGQRVRWAQWGWMAVVLLGLMLTTPAWTDVGTDGAGVGAAIAAGVAFSGYNLLTQLSLNPKNRQPSLHPVTFSLLQFGVMLGLSTGALGLVTITIQPEDWPAVWGMSLVSAIAAMTAYLLNNMGIQQVGAATASVVNSITPILTALLAAIAIQETLTLRQLIGVVVVTVSIAALSLRRPTVKSP
jgi:drug/metabolite transporter (DMT)-like permease